MAYPLSRSAYPLQPNGRVIINCPDFVVIVDQSGDTPGRVDLLYSNLEPIAPKTFRGHETDLVVGPPLKAPPLTQQVNVFGVTNNNAVHDLTVPDDRAALYVLVPAGTHVQVNKPSQPVLNELGAFNHALPKKATQPTHVATSSPPANVSAFPGMQPNDYGMTFAELVRKRANEEFGKERVDKIWNEGPDGPLHVARQLSRRLAENDILNARQGTRSARLLSFFIRQHKAKEVISNVESNNARRRSA